MWDIFAYVGIFFLLVLGSLIPAVFLGRVLKLSNPRIQPPPDGLHWIEFSRHQNIGGTIGFKAMIIYTVDGRSHLFSVDFDESRTDMENPEDAVKFTACRDASETVLREIRPTLRFAFLGMFREMKRSLGVTESPPRQNLEFQSRPPGHLEIL